MRIYRFLNLWYLHYNPFCEIHYLYFSTGICSCVHSHLLPLSLPLGIWLPAFLTLVEFFSETHIFSVFLIFWMVLKWPCIWDHSIDSSLPLWLWVPTRSNLFLHPLLFFFPLPDILTFIYLFFVSISYIYKLGFPGGSESKDSAFNAEDLGSIPGSGRFPGEGNGSPLQYSCLGNPWIEESGRL